MKSNITAAISTRILVFLAAGMTLPEAFDAVFGAGAYNKLAGEVFEVLKP